MIIIAGYCVVHFIGAADEVDDESTDGHKVTSRYS